MEKCQHKSKSNDFLGGGKLLKATGASYTFIERLEYTSKIRFLDLRATGMTEIQANIVAQVTR